jgi:hypothetical protein
MKKEKYLRFGIVFLAPLVFIFSQCLHQVKPADPRGGKYAGSAACLKCHKDVYQNYFHSAHFLTSRVPSLKNVHGSFKPDSNTVAFKNNIVVVMEKQHDSLYEVSYAGGKRDRKERLDIAFGSNRGESFLYWKNNQVYQLPVTYYISLHQWGNSPAYSADSANFSRVIGTRCFECHASYIKALPDSTGTINNNLLDRNSLIMGVDCERCHGPGAGHVNFHTHNPAEKQPMYITKIGSLTRQQRIDLCSVCHSGNSNIMTRSTFGFKPGDTLAHYTIGNPFHAYQDIEKVDVHGNQVKLLTNSKCFMNSKIECATCHSVHSNEAKSVAVYSARCSACHSQANHNYCKIAPQLGAVINGNCIECHMPVKTSHSIVINGVGKQISAPFLARTHLIAIYPDDSKRIMAMLKAADAAKKQ